MKTLLLMRHAKASPSNAINSDFDRPLLPEGLVAAQRVGKFLRDEEIAIDAALSSAAVRAQETIAAVLERARMSLDVRYDPRLYEGGPSQVLEVIAEVEDNLTSVFLVGHNPVFEDLIHSLTGASVHLSPGTLTQMHLEVGRWGEIGQGTANLRKVVRPKDLLNERRSSG